MAVHLLPLARALVGGSWADFYRHLRSIEGEEHGLTICEKAELCKVEACLKGLRYYEQGSTQPDTSKIKPLSHDSMWFWKLLASAGTAAHLRRPCGLENSVVLDAEILRDGFYTVSKATSSPRKQMAQIRAVSYTHLTLPTKA